MYVTAQKVIAPDGRCGINAFFHLHGASGFPTIPLQPKDVILVSEMQTGTLMQQQIEIPPGGNKVTCFLDVVAPDDTSTEEIAAALDRFKGLVPASLPFVTVLGKVGIHLNAEISLWDDIDAELRALREHIEKVLAVAS